LLRVSPHLGVMRIVVNMAHGNLYAFGAFVMAWLVSRAIASTMCRLEWRFC
jgi:branched-subunit amino acid ABC-type transport system permease component